jgi:hypothetical protein
MGKQIKFNFSIDKSRSSEKDVDGKKSRYLAGAASGLKEDAHGERVTQGCIDSMCRQAESGDILLYADKHGISESEDIGIMDSFKVLENGDWYVEFRLYDESDALDDASIQKADKLWSQVNGLPPYTRPRQKGFSIEGEIPDDAILIDKKERLGIIDDIILTGVVAVPQPAYEDSVIHAIYKAFDVVPPWKIRKTIRKRMSDTIRKDTQARYDRDRYEIEEERDSMIAETVKNFTENDAGILTNKLKMIFNEYDDLMIGLILDNPTLVGSDACPVMASPYMEAESAEDVDPKRMAMLEAVERRLEEIAWSRRDLNENPESMDAGGETQTRQYQSDS